VDQRPILELEGELTPDVCEVDPADEAFCHAELHVGARPLGAIWGAAVRRPGVIEWTDMRLPRGVLMVVPIATCRGPSLGDSDRLVALGDVAPLASESASEPAHPATQNMSNVAIVVGAMVHHPPCLSGLGTNLVEGASWVHGRAPCGATHGRPLLRHTQVPSIKTVKSQTK
jgi:hypothetical protein